MRRLSTVGAALVALALLVGPAAAADAAPRRVHAAAPAAPAATPKGKTLSVVTVSGLLDPVLVDFIERTLTEAERSGPTWVVLQLNTTGATVSDQKLAHLLNHIRTSPADVAVWVGPSGSKATGAGAQIAAVADDVGIAHGSHLGRLSDPVIDPTLFSAPYRASLAQLSDSVVNAEQALKLGLTAHPAATLGSLVIELPGVATRVIKTKEGPRRAPTAPSTPVFRSLPIGDKLMHTVASPAVAYLLFVMGMALIVFELFTAGVGVAGLVGAGGFLLGSYGLGVLPVHPWAVALLVLSMAAFAVDVQTGVPRFWTAVGALSLIGGSIFLYRGMSVPLLTLGVGVVGILLFMLAGMPAMVRTRFSTPTIGRDWMIGEEGEVVSDVAPDGVVRVRDALWRARTNRATPVTAGGAIRVVEVDGLLLEVEPLEGGAKDYRR